MKVDPEALVIVNVKIIAAVALERERCAQIAEAIDSGRGNEKQIARAIRDGKSYRTCSR